MGIHNYTVKDWEGKDISLSSYKDHVMLIVNTACAWGFTSHFQGLEELYKQYKDKKFVILAFPCNQFGAQDPGSNEEIQNFTKIKYGVTFPVLAKIEVNGENEDPLFTFLKAEKTGILGSQIKWNFTKFLIDREGNVVKRFAPDVKPEAIKNDIEALLGWFF